MSAAMSRRIPIRLVLLSLAAVLVGALWAAPAQAHALATGTQPASGEVLDAPPDDVVVEFNEPVDPVDAATGVVAPDGDRADTGIAETDDAATLVIEVDADQEGTYLVAYRVVSDDGHPVSGTFTFSVGTETEPPSADALAGGTDGLVQALLYADRWAGYAGLALALGAGVLLATGARPRAFCARLVAGGLSAVAITAVLGIVLQAAYESGVSLSELDATALQAVMESSFGLAALLRLLIVLLAMPLLRVVVTAAGPPGRAVTAGLAGIGLAMAATWPLAGHAMTAVPLVVAYVADWVHVAAALTWAGGVAVLLILAFHTGGEIPKSTADFWIALVPWLMANLVVAGLASALLHIHSLEALTDTEYGRLVMIKAAVLIVVVVVGLFTRKAVVRGREGRKLLRRLAGAEVGLVALILGAVVVLVQAVPADTALTENQAQQVESTEQSAIFTSDAFAGQLVLEPGRPGPNGVRLLVDDLGGAAFEAVEWEATYGLEGAEPETLRLIELRTGILGGEVSLSEAGRWVFTFTLTDAAGNSATAEAAIDIS